MITIFLSFIAELRSNTSSNFKKEVLEKYKNEPVVRELLQACYNPFQNYYITNLQIAHTPFYKEKDFTAAHYITFIETLSKANDRSSTPAQTQQKLQEILGEAQPEIIDSLCAVVERDLQSGINISTINKVFGFDFISEFPYQRCSLLKDVNVDKWEDWDKGHYLQLKADGMYINLNHYPNGDVILLSRNGSCYDSSKFPEIVIEAKENLAPNTQTHGEIVVMRNGVLLPRQESNGLMNKILKGQYTFTKYEEPFYYVWDSIPLECVKTKGECKIPYNSRFETLKNRLVESNNITDIQTKLVYSKAEAMKASQDLIAEGMEGGILKHRDTIWKDGTSKEQIKFKVEFDVDLVILDFLPAAKNSKNKDMFGSILCGTSDGLLEVGVSSFTDKVRKEIHENREQYRGKIMCVKANNIMYPKKEGEKCSLFLPGYVSIRSDKNIADDLARVISSYESAIKE